MTLDWWDSRPRVLFYSFTEDLVGVAVTAGRIRGGLLSLVADSVTFVFRTSTDVSCTTLWDEYLTILHETSLSWAVQNVNWKLWKKDKHIKVGVIHTISYLHVIHTYKKDRVSYLIHSFKKFPRSYLLLATKELQSGQSWIIPDNMFWRKKNFNQDKVELSRITCFGENNKEFWWSYIKYTGKGHVCFATIFGTIGFKTW